ncbi:hypothetical protein [Acetobacterium woodii]|uniref:Zinc-ribbon domain-containing protein n=1 Tax=Acetobacterium woodii (strain ATCC 29683 / DSM 1030 / JCM 2381 / KCTC 1655 / WB1) TaxID=931626 RepID=H6LK97_ACEWD|nr:hypothetical protein [Acetobacterium woodii]AFA50017.1 hypothetical protein Awo_c32890 [Acetobacterium woodii DSM 1030]
MNFPKTFFCSQCGSKLKGNNQKCPHCGFNFQSKNPYGDKEALGSGGIGWSDKINDPLYAKYQYNKRKVILLFSMVLIIAIPILLVSIGDLELNQEGFFVIAIVTSMFFLIAFFSIRDTKRYGKEWEGIVIDKKESLQTKNKIQRNVIIIQLENHNIKELSFADNLTHYAYYNIGDRIKSHNKKNIHTIEKFDKSKDVILFCPSCGYLCDSRDNYCRACGSPLLKGSEKINIIPF